MKPKWYVILLLAVLAVLLVAACVVLIIIIDPFHPDPTVTPKRACVDNASARTKGCDEFRRSHAKVYWNGSQHSKSRWYQLAAGDTLTTDADGEAELNFSDCWDGKLWLFDNSSGKIRVRDCRKAQYDEVSNLCVPNGTVYAGKCLGEFSATSSSVKLTKLGSSFAITALPGDRDISLVVVLEGRVQVDPVLSFEPFELDEGQGGRIAGGDFYFTMPDNRLSEVGGLPPREPYPLEQLPPVARELGIVDWMRRVGELAEEDGVLPDNWPDLDQQQEPDEAWPAYFVSSGGGWLSDARAQEALYRAIEWRETGPDGSQEGGTVFVFVGDEPVDAINDLGYEPDLSHALLEEAGYDLSGEWVILLYPGEDPELERAARVVARYLKNLKLEEVGIEALPGEEVREIAEDRRSNNEPVIVLWR